MKKALISIIWAIVVLALAVSCATKAAAPEPEKAPAAAETKAETPAPAPAPEKAPEPAKEEAVILEVNGAKTGFATLEEAFAAVPAGSEATVTICSDIAVKKAIPVKEASVTLTDNGKAVTVADEVNDGDGIQYVFMVEGAGRLTVSPKAGITFLAADPAKFSVTRVMFLVGTGYKEPEQMSGYLELNPGTTVTGVKSTSFGGIVRGYGEVVINGGTYTSSANNKGNGLFTFYSKAAINDGVFSGNESVTVGMIMVTVECELVINGGTFENNSGATSGLMKVNSKATCTINGGTFRNNKAFNDGAGAIDATGTVTINGGVFADNAYADVVVAEKGVFTKAESVTVNVK